MTARVATANATGVTINGAATGLSHRIQDRTSVVYDGAVFQLACTHVVAEYWCGLKGISRS